LQEFSSSWLSAETQISTEMHTCTHFPRNISSNKTNKKGLHFSCQVQYKHLWLLHAPVFYFLW